MGVVTGLIAAGAAVVSSGVQAISANQKAQKATHIEQKIILRN